MTLADQLQALGSAKYVRLTTFRKDGRPVPTPVWVVDDGGALLVTTTADAGKVKRLRHTSRVLLVPCDARGRVAPDAVEVEGDAVVVTDPDARMHLLSLLKAKYGLLARVLLLRRRNAPGVCIRITVR